MDIETQKQNIIDVAASLLKNDIQYMLSQKDEYVSPHFLTTEADSLRYLPGSLETLLSKLFVGKNKQNFFCSIGQCIVQAVRPRGIISPLQLGLAVQMHTHFRSRYIFDTLHALGFCSSYNEVQKFERNATVSDCFVLEG